MGITYRKQLQKLKKGDTIMKQSFLTPMTIWDIKDKELINLIIGRDGGKTTTIILDEIILKPRNKNQLAKKLKLDYNTITHHIKIMQNHEYIVEEPFDNVIYYHPSDKLFKSLEEYKFIKKYLLNKNKK